MIEVINKINSLAHTQRKTLIDDNINTEKKKNEFFKSFLQKFTFTLVFRIIQ